MGNGEGGSFLEGKLDMGSGRKGGGFDDEGDLLLMEQQATAGWREGQGGGLGRWRDRGGFQGV